MFTAHCAGYLLNLADLCSPGNPRRIPLLNQIECTPPDVAIQVQVGRPIEDVARCVLVASDVLLSSFAMHEHNYFAPWLCLLNIERARVCVTVSSYTHLTFHRHCSTDYSRAKCSRIYAAVNP